MDFWANTLTVLGLLVLWVVIVGLLAPFETLGWWAGWYGERVARPMFPVSGDDIADMPESSPDVLAQAVPPRRQRPKAYVVYLTGIAGAAANALMPEDTEFLNRLRDKLPQVELLRDVFPYSVTSRGLLSRQRLFGAFWRWVERLRAKRRFLGALAGLINLHNGFQVVVSADKRYGPFYNLGTALAVARVLKRRGYPFGRGVPVVLLGYSGGGQIAVGAAQYLKEVIGAPLYVVALGGTFASDPGLDHIDRMAYLWGERDFVHRGAIVMFAGRWPWFKNSHWNRFKAAGKATFVRLPRVDHNGPDGYLDVHRTFDDGRTFLDGTVDAVQGAILDLLRTPNPAAPVTPRVAAASERQPTPA